MADAATAKQALIKFFASIGVDIPPGDEDALRLQSVAFLHQMNQIFGDEASKKIKVEDYSPEVVAAIKKGLQERIDAKIIEIDKLQAVVKQDLDFLTKDYTPQFLAKNHLKAIYEKHKGYPEAAYREILAESKDPKTVALIAEIDKNAPHFLDHLAATVAFLESPDSAVFQNLKTLQDNKFFETKVEPTKLAAADPALELENAIKAVKAMIGMDKPDATWGAAEQEKLKAATLLLQKDPYFGQDLADEDKDGLYDFSFSVHMKKRVEAMPETTDAEKTNKADYLAFVETMEILQQRGVPLISKADLLNVASATQAVEEGLAGLAPMLNGALEKAGGNVLADLFAKDLVRARIPGIEPENIGGTFDFSSQAALQGLMMVLSHQAVLDLPPGPEGKPWLYSPAKGAIIKAKLRDKENPPAFLKFMDKEAQENFKALLEGDKLDDFIASLDYLSEQGQVVDYPIFQGQGQSIAPRTKDILQEEISRLQKAGNDDAVRLLDTLVYKYAPPFTLNAILDKDDGVDLGIDPLMDHDKRLKDFYKKALESFNKEKPAGYHDFEAFLLPMLDTMGTLPFGLDAQRFEFKSGIRLAIRDAAGDPDKFVSGVNQVLEDIREKHGDITYTNRHEISPVLHPKLEHYPAMRSGGKTFTADDVIQAYNDFHLAHARGENREFGRPKPLALHTYIPFKDNNGTIRIAALDKAAMVFTIEEVNVDLMKRYLHPELFNDNEVEKTSGKSFKALKALPLSERAELLRQVDPAFALVSPGHGYAAMTLSTLDFYDYMAGNDPDRQVRSLAEVVQINAEGAQEVLDNAREKHDTPLIGRGTTLDSERMAQEFERTTGYTVIPREDRDALRRYGQSLRAAPTILNKETLELLQKYDGLGNFQIGKALRTGIRIKGVEVADNPGNKPMIAWLDRDTHTIRAIPAPDDLLDGEKRGAYIEALKQHTSEPNHIYEGHIQARFPELHMITAQYRAEDTLYKDINRVSKGLGEQLDKLGYGPKGTACVSDPFYEAAKEPEKESKWSMLREAFTFGNDEDERPVEGGKRSCDAKPPPPSQ